MSLKIQTTRKDFTPVPAGTHLAICTMVVDLGVQDDSKYVPRPKVYLRWELPGQLATWSDKSNKDHTAPMVIGKSYTKSLATKANLRADLESWRGKLFTDADLASFDITTILGQPCMLRVDHHEVGDKTYADVAIVMGAPKDTIPKASGKLIAYDVDEPDPEMFALLPSWLQKKIGDRILESKHDPVPAPQAAAAAAKEFDDKIPF